MVVIVRGGGRRVGAEGADEVGGVRGVDGEGDVGSAVLIIYEGGWDKLLSRNRLDAGRICSGDVPHGVDGKRGFVVVVLLFRNGMTVCEVCSYRRDT